MDRRELLKMIAVLTGGAVVGGQLLMTGCKSESSASVGAEFTEADIAFLDEVAETIIPTTGTPGAKAAQVGAFMALMVKDCYTAEDQKIFKEGMGLLNKASNAANKNDFLKASPEERTSLLTQLDKEAKSYQDTKKQGDPTPYFTMMKQLTLLGYFTSKPGATQALRYVAVPGKYDGDFPYKKGDRAWAT